MSSLLQADNSTAVSSPFGRNSYQSQWLDGSSTSMRSGGLGRADSVACRSLPPSLSHSSLSSLTVAATSATQPSAHGRPFIMQRSTSNRRVGAALEGHRHHDALTIAALAGLGKAATKAFTSLPRSNSRHRQILNLPSRRSLRVGACDGPEPVSAPGQKQLLPTPTSQADSYGPSSPYSPFGPGSSPNAPSLMQAMQERFTAPASSSPARSVGTIAHPHRVSLPAPMRHQSTVVSGNSHSSGTIVLSPSIGVHRGPPMGLPHPVIQRTMTRSKSLWAEAQRQGLLQVQDAGAAGEDEGCKTSQETLVEGAGDSFDGELDCVDMCLHPSPTGYLTFPTHAPTPGPSPAAAAAASTPFQAMYGAPPTVAGGGAGGTGVPGLMRQRSRGLSSLPEVYAQVHAQALKPSMLLNECGELPQSHPHTPGAIARSLIASHGQSSSPPATATGPATGPVLSAAALPACVPPLTSSFGPESPPPAPYSDQGDTCRWSCANVGPLPSLQSVSASLRSGPRKSLSLPLSRLDVSPPALAGGAADNNPRLVRRGKQRGVWGEVEIVRQPPHSDIV